MYICICNALTERQIDALIDEGIDTLEDIYVALQCRPQCGKCVADIQHKIRVAEKNMSRADDDNRLASAQVSRDDLQRENSAMSDFDMEKSEVLHWG